MHFAMLEGGAKSIARIATSVAKPPFGIVVVDFPGTHATKTRPPTVTNEGSGHSKPGKWYAHAPQLFFEAWWLST